MDNNNKTSEAQLKAINNWVENNRNHSNYIKAKGSCKSFIKNKATEEDIKDIIQLANEILKNKYEK